MVCDRPPGARAGAQLHARPRFTFDDRDPSRSHGTGRRRRASTDCRPSPSDRSSGCHRRGGGRTCRRSSGISINVTPVMSVKFLDDQVPTRSALLVRVAILRNAAGDPMVAGDLVDEITPPDDNTIARVAWAPKQPGAEIVQNVVPFIAVALIGFALLAAFVLRYMRRTAAAIAAGESRLRHLAMHDPLCGLPNRIFFGERLEAVIEEVKNGSAPAAVFYIDLDHFKDVNDTLGHHIGDELIRNVTLRLSHTLRGGDLVARLGGDEFAVISSIAGDSEKMLGLAQRIIAAICA